MDSLRQTVPLRQDSPTIECHQEGQSSKVCHTPGYTPDRQHFTREHEWDDWREPHLKEDTQGKCLPQPDQARAAAGVGVIVPIPGPLIVIIATPSIRAPAATIAPAIVDVIVFGATARARPSPPACSGEAV